MTAGRGKTGAPADDTKGGVDASRILDAQMTPNGAELEGEMSMDPVPSDALVFFGASGDLAFKQIFPALLGLVGDEGLDVPIVGVAKAGWKVDDLRTRAKASVESHGRVDAAKLTRLLSLLRYVDGDYNDPQTFDKLKQTLGPAKRPLHYLAIPPSMFSVVVAALARSGLNENARLVVEKPFGHDRESAQALNHCLHEFFPEKAIYRIDHYLGKEPVQSIVYTRFANAPFESLWNRTYVRSIQITMAEAFGVDDRGSFYDATGALRDVVQNHMLQVLANVMMDPPTGEDHESMRDQKAALLKAVRPLDAKSIVRGQYRGYRQVKGVKLDSTVETYVAVKLSVDSWRWAGVPIYIRAGKCLPLTAAEVTVEYKPPPRATFGDEENAPPGYMRLRISPDVGVAIGLRVKHPGERMTGDSVELMLSERAASLIPPYQRLLGDAMRGNDELFGREDVVDAQWRIVQPILVNPPPCETYEPGTWGPEAADKLIGADGPWRNPKPAKTG
jgi:glucose-6-phosphate 1-dehydrogenase